MSAFSSLTESEKVLLQQVAANPIFMKVLKKEKEDLDQQILNFWALEHESDLEYRRRNESLHEKRRYLNEQISFYESLLLI
ncbi:MAG: hypothetical protein BV456_05925 [Thermoplasmata archaeon M8B2D]|nr:MAG: hypothetical protein BV456_05925 [Thermoplasmata archaeon M8B2D]